MPTFPVFSLGKRTTSAASGNAPSAPRLWSVLAASAASLAPPFSANKTRYVILLAFQETSIADREFFAQPAYHPGIYAVMIASGLILIITSLMVFKFNRANKRAAAGGKIIAGMEGFRYTL